MKKHILHFAQLRHRGERIHPRHRRDRALWRVVLRVVLRAVAPLVRLRKEEQSWA
jgi:hypothetical protein